jgi:hypothetical protein
MKTFKDFPEYPQRGNFVLTSEYCRMCHKWENENKISFPDYLKLKENPNLEYDDLTRKIISK